MKITNGRVHCTNELVPPFLASLLCYCCGCIWTANSENSPTGTRLLAVYPNLQRAEETSFLEYVRLPHVSSVPFWHPNLREPLTNCKGFVKVIATLSSLTRVGTTTNMSST